MAFWALAASLWVPAKLTDRPEVRVLQMLAWGFAFVVFLRGTIRGRERTALLAPTAEVAAVVGSS